MKRIGLVLSLVLLLTGCGAEPVKTPGPETPPAVAQPQETEAWREAYKTFLTDLCERETAIRNIDRPDYDPNEYVWELGELSSSYCLYDVDKDGAPELFIRYGGDEAGCLMRVYTFVEDAVTQVGEFPFGYSCLYTWPEENGVIFNWGHMGGHIVDRLSLTDGALVRETVFEEGIDGPTETYTEMADLVPGSKYLWENRTTLGHVYMDGGVTGREAPLLLPIDEYGMEETRKGPDPVKNETARTAIQAVLDGEKPLFGVSADGFGGDTGEALLEDYLAVVDRYATVPQTVRKLAWLDMNGDGQTECLLYLQGDEGQYVVLAEENGTVYAYCENYCDFYTVDVNGVFRPGYAGDAFVLSFAGEQCCQYTAPYDPAVPEVNWQTVS